MVEKDIINLALSEEFNKAAIIDTKEIIFDPAFRPYCEENLCGQYGANYSCPPDCGTPEEMKQKVLKCSKALVLQTIWDIEDLSDKARVKNAKNSHNAGSLRLLKQMKNDGYSCFMVGASGCNLCDNCKINTGEACKFAEYRFSCMSAYCIFVKKLAESCRMEYDYKDGKIPLFSMIAFD